MGTKPKTGTKPDMRLKSNKVKYGTVENRDKTAPRGKLNMQQSKKESMQSGSNG